MTKIILSSLAISFLCNLLLYHFYDSASSELHIARQDVSRMSLDISSLQKQLEDAYSLREIEAKTSQEWKDEQGSLEDKKDVLVAKITSNTQAYPCTKQVSKEGSVNAQESNYVSLDDKLPVDVVSVLSEAASDLQR